MTDPIYKQLAKRLDALPNGYPATDTGEELRLLAYLFTPEEAQLAIQLKIPLESVESIAERIGADFHETRNALKAMAKKGLIKGGLVDGGIGYGLLPFVVGIYEFQASRLDEEMARLFEAYYQKAFTQMLEISPQVHRVIPVYETIKNDMEVRPFESAVGILESMQSWGVVDCICRQQKALIGDPCEHSLDICMTFSERPGAFDNSRTVTAQSKEEALATLQRAADEGLVHSVSNNQEGLWYICNCCTCSCGILRGMSEVGIANVVAHSAYVNTVDEMICSACETCLEYCQFDAITVDNVASINTIRCVGCGVCVPFCDTGALNMVRRPQEEVLEVPVTEHDWGMIRAKERGLDLTDLS